MGCDVMRKGGCALESGIATDDCGTETSAGCAGCWTAGAIVEGWGSGMKTGACGVWVGVDAAGPVEVMFSSDEGRFIFPE
jgi:hypothetical protein